MATILFSAVVFAISGGGVIGFLLVIPIISFGVWYLTKEEKQKPQRVNYVKKQDVFFIGRNESLEKNPPPEGEYWKNVKVTREIVNQIFEDLEFQQSWMMVGYGSVLARKRLEFDNENFGTYSECQDKMLRELANDLEFDSALEEFLKYAKEKLSEKKFCHDFPQLFAYLVRRDVEKSFDAIEKFLATPLKIDKDDLCSIIGTIEFPEWNKIAAAICREEKVEFFQDNFSNAEIAEDCFHREAKYFEWIEKNIPENNLLLRRYHVMMKKVNCK